MATVFSNSLSLSRLSVSPCLSLPPLSLVSLLSPCISFVHLTSARSRWIQWRTAAARWTGRLKKWANFGPVLRQIWGQWKFLQRKLENNCRIAGLIQRKLAKMIEILKNLPNILKILCLTVLTGGLVDVVRVAVIAAVISERSLEFKTQVSDSFANLAKNSLNKNDLAASNPQHSLRDFFEIWPNFVRNWRILPAGVAESRSHRVVHVEDGGVAVPRVRIYVWKNPIFGKMESKFRKLALRTTSSKLNSAQFLFNNFAWFL